MLKDFTSLPQAEEQAFAVYEEQTRQNSVQAKKVALIISGIVFLITLVVVFSQGGSTSIEERFNEGQEDKSEKEATSLGEEQSE